MELHATGGRPYKFTINELRLKNPQGSAPGPNDYMTIQAHLEDLWAAQGRMRTFGECPIWYAEHAFRIKPLLPIKARVRPTGANGFLMNMLGYAVLLTLSWDRAGSSTGTIGARCSRGAAIARGSAAPSYGAVTASGSAGG
jgi:hypothetical protein